MSLFQYLSENSRIAAGFDNNECIKLIRELSGDYNENIGLLEILYRVDKNIPSECFLDLIYQQSAHFKK